VQYREYALDGSHKWKTEFLGYKGSHPNAVGVREAERLRKEFMAGVNVKNCKPTTSMTVKDFWASRFEPQVVLRKKPSGQKHYRYLWRKHLEPLIGKIRLSDVDVDTVESVVGTLMSCGYSPQTVLHAKNAISALFRHAKKLKLYRDDNPAGLVELGEVVPSRRRPTYSTLQARLVIQSLPSPAREMATLSVATSMGPAEMCGITLRWCNLTDRAKYVNGITLAPYSIAVMENVYEGKRGTLKHSSRQRIEGLTPELASSLLSLVIRSPRQDEDGPLFQSRNGTPVDTHNIANRVFRPLAERLGFPVTWYGFRRYHSGAAGQLEGVALEDRQRTMGHTDSRMTLYYSVADVDRRRAIPAGILDALNGEETVQ
jgi:integrase